MNKLNDKLSYMVSNIDIGKKLKCCCFILIQTSDNSFHWTLLCRNNSNIYYFDSYGIRADCEMHNIPQQERY